MVLSYNKNTGATKREATADSATAALLCLSYEQNPTMSRAKW